MMQWFGSLYHLKIYPAHTFNLELTLEVSNEQIIKKIQIKEHQKSD